MRDVCIGSGGAINDASFILEELSLVHVHNYQIVAWEREHAPLNGFTYESVRKLYGQASGAREIV